jgi:hypothetical protein
MLGFRPINQFLAQHEREEDAEDVAADGGVVQEYPDGQSAVLLGYAGRGRLPREGSFLRANRQAV